MFLGFTTFLTIFLVIVVLISLISVIAGVPFVPTHAQQAQKMMELSGIQPGMQVIDLGSGAGRLLFLAARSGATTIGYELNPFLVSWSKMVVRLRGLSSQITVYTRSIYDADVRNADVVLCFLMDRPMKKLESKLFAEMKPGSKIISYVFPFPNHQYVKKEQGLFVYEV